MLVSLEQARVILQKSGIVVIPTETVYGLAARADDKVAIEKIYQAKGRPRDNPLICHFYDIDQIERSGVVLPMLARTLFQAFAPGPLSLLLDLPLPSPLSAASGGRGTIICRIPNHSVTQALLRALEFPLAAPSANTSGRMSGTVLSMIMADLQDRVDGYLDGGAAVIGIESTIVDAREPDKLAILRPGVIGKTEILRAVTHLVETGELARVPVITMAADSAASFTTPGARYAHYAPCTPIVETHSFSVPKSGQAKKIAYLATDEGLQTAGIKLSRPYEEQGGIWYLSLGSRADLLGIARRLYYTLYVLDQLQVSQAYIVQESWGYDSVGIALADRIGKILGKK